MEEDLLDWELLHSSDTESIGSITSYEILGTSSDGMILSDHFSVDDNNLIEKSDETIDPIQYGVLESGNDYGSETLNQGEGLVYKNEIFGDGEVIKVSSFEADDDKHIESETVAELTGGTISCYESQSGVEEHIEDLSKSWSDSGRNELVSGDSEIVSDSGAIDLVAVNSGDESKSGEIVWWKMPFELVKYSVFKISPVWSVSLAAAVVGLVLLERRRLDDMKKKAQRFNLKVAIDDKKVMHVMNQAARLNEMFTEVRRVPVIRPAVPSPGAWPALTLR